MSYPQGEEAQQARPSDAPHGIVEHERVPLTRRQVYVRQRLGVIGGALVTLASALYLSLALRAPVQDVIAQVSAFETCAAVQPRRLFRSTGRPRSVQSDTRACAPAADRWMRCRRADLQRPGRPERKRRSDLLRAGRNVTP